LADRSYAALDPLHVVRRRVCAVARLRLEARLFDPPPARTPRAISRPRIVGACQPALEQRLGRADMPWRRLEGIGWYGYGGRPERPGALAGHAAWLAERFRQHRGNADVVRQELAAELGIAVSLRTVERAVAHLRRELAAEALATVRFETPPGRQLQIDFGERWV
jgi:hypothetical protein